MINKTDHIDNDIEHLNLHYNKTINALRDTTENIELKLDNESQLWNTQLSHLNQAVTALTIKLNEIPSLTSCAALPPSSPSGYYWVTASNGSAVHVYCDMTRSCGNITGGWMRVAQLDMTNSSHQCPSALRQRTDSNIRTCVRNTDSPGCSSVQYSTANIHYSRVCGKVIAYQVGTPNAFFQCTNIPISVAYVDGVSLTHGDPRQHVWTFAAALAERVSGGSGASSCNCMSSSATPPPSFVGTDYFCDAGLSFFLPNNPPGFQNTDPLWDGEGCGGESSCCDFNTPPWFHKQLPQPTTDDIEMRVCRDEDADNEDIAIKSIEIYTR